MAWCPKRRQKADKRGFANAYASLGEGQDGGKLGERPGKQPDAEGEEESTGDGEECGECKKCELNSATEEPAKDEDVRALGNGAEGVAQAGETAAKTNRAALEKRATKPGEKNGNGEDGQEEEG